MGFCCFNPRSLSLRPAARVERAQPHTPARPLRTHTHIATLFRAREVRASGRDICPLQAERRARVRALRSANSQFNHQQCPVSLSLIPTPPPPTLLPPVSLAPPSPRPDPPRPGSPPPIPWVQGWGAGGASTAPAPWPPSDQRRRERRGAGSTALLAPLVLGLGLVLACLSLLLARWSAWEPGIAVCPGEARLPCLPGTVPNI